MTPRSAADAPAAASVTVRPGALTNLIAALVRADPGPGWDAPLLEGEVIGGRFEIAREMGRGGFGVVYEAHDRALSRAVAFKAIHASAGVRDERLVAEAEAAAQLAHPNIVHLYDVGRD